MDRNVWDEGTCPACGGEGYGPALEAPRLTETDPVYKVRIPCAKCLGAGVETKRREPHGDGD